MKARYRDRTSAPARATLGFAADDAGCGVAYARVESGGEHLLRVPFRVRRFAGLGGREVAYAALSAVADRLHDRGLSRVAFELSDRDLVSDVIERRAVPAPLTVPYVKLRCTLNKLDGFALSSEADSEDLAQRARAEVSLHVAA